MYIINRMDKLFCNQCGECCRKIAVDFNKNLMYRDGIQNLTENFKDMLSPVVNNGEITYCICKYLRGNQCSNPNKPDICKNFPSSPFAYLPESCAQSGNVFIESEKIKQRVRKLKEEIIDYNILVNTVTNKFERNGLLKIIQNHERFISKYLEYGSNDW